MPVEVEDIEIELLFEGIRQRYGYDFSNYARDFLKRRIKRCQMMAGIDSIAQVQHRVLHDSAFFERLLEDLTIAVTEMFRDPSFYRTFRDKVCPHLRTYPFIRIWHSGCSTGEEVYSMAIMLGEEQLYERSQIYATDVDQTALQKAKEGIFPLAAMRQYSRNYQKSGGRKAFAYYYRANDKMAIMDRSLKANIVFADHSLTTDGVFGEMQVIICRNVLIYFNRSLQDRVLTIFKESLCASGFLCLGSMESIDFSAVAGDFEAIATSEKIYRKK
jgi:chemotaxis protein methyltransferase CheR